MEIRDCKLITIPEEKKSYLIFIGAEIIFINDNAYKCSGKIESIIPEGFYINGEFFNWNQVSDIIHVNMGNVYYELTRKDKINIKE